MGAVIEKVKKGSTADIEGQLRPGKNDKFKPLCPRILNPLKKKKKKKKKIKEPTFVLFQRFSSTNRVSSNSPICVVFQTDKPIVRVRCVPRKIFVSCSELLARSYSLQYELHLYFISLRIFYTVTTTRTFIFYTRRVKVPNFWLAGISYITDMIDTIADCTNTTDCAFRFIHFVTNNSFNLSYTPLLRLEG